MLTRSLKVVTLLSLFSFVLGLAGHANADTVSYWRFDQDDQWDTQLDDSVGGHPLDNSAWHVSTEKGGLWDPVPNSGASNSRHLQFDTSWEYDDYVYTDAGSPDIWTPSEGFTIEAMVKPSAVRDAPIVCHCADTNPNSGWSFELAESGSHCSPKLRIYNGSDKAEITFEEFSVAAGQTYALAATYDGNSEIELFAREKADPSVSLNSKSKIVSAFGEVAASDNPLMVGAHGKPFSDNRDNFGGVLDEVRFSSGALSESDLLMATPEPGTTCLAILAAAAGVFAVWRKKRKQDSADRGE